MDIQTILKGLSEQFHDALSRCENCARQGHNPDCDQCQHNKVQFANLFVDLLNLVEPDTEKRFAFSVIAVDPHLSDDAMQIAGQGLYAAARQAKLPPALEEVNGQTLEVQRSDIAAGQLEAIGLGQQTKAPNNNASSKTQLTERHYALLKLIRDQRGFIPFDQLAEPDRQLAQAMSNASDKLIEEHQNFSSWGYRITNAGLAEIARKE